MIEFRRKLYVSPLAPYALFAFGGLLVRSCLEQAGVLGVYVLEDKANRDRHLARDELEFECLSTRMQTPDGLRRSATFLAACAALFDGKLKWVVLDANSGRAQALRFYARERNPFDDTGRLAPFRYFPHSLRRAFRWEAEVGCT